MNKSKAKSSLKALYEELNNMDAPQAQRLYDLAFAALHPNFLMRVIFECPLTPSESEIYASLTQSVFLAKIVKEMAKARLQALGVYKRRGVHDEK